MKKVFILLLFFSFGAATFAQPWTENLPKNKSNKQLTLFDYKNAFDSYWAPYNVKNGHYSKDGITKKASGWKQFNRWFYNWEPMVDKYGNFPNVSAFDMFNSNSKKNPASNSPKSANWTKLGPSSSAGGYAGIGRLNCISFHPSNNSTYWVGAPAGGLWKTTNNGSTWSCSTDFNDVIGVSDIIIPSDYETSNTIYIATGDRDGHDNFTVGVLKSTDDGANWFYTGLKFDLSDNENINRLLLDPNDDNTIIAATSVGTYKTTDAGISWDKINTIEFIDMEYKPGNFDVLYGSTKKGDIYLSTNGGLDWSKTLNTSGKRVEIAVTPANTSVVFAIIAGSDNGLYGIYKSGDNGFSFVEVFSGNTKNLLGWYNGGNDDQGGQGFYDLAIAISPTDAQTVLIGGINTWRTTDGGKNWSLIAHWNGSGAPTIHADVHALTYHSNGTLYQCNDGGIYTSSNDGTNFYDKTNGIVHSQIYKLSVSQTVSDETLIGLQDNGTKLKSGSSWRDVKGGDGMECIIDYTDEDIQYGSVYYGRISRTENHWSTSTDITPDDVTGAWVTPYVINPISHSIIYAGYSNMWKSNNKGDSWTKISTSINSAYKIRNIAITKSNTNYIYASDPYNIWKTTIGGSSWTNITSDLPGNFITSIAIKYDDPNTIWVTLGSYDNNSIYESTDGGSSWTNISAGLPEIPAYSVVQNNRITDEVNLYIGTELGVFFKHGKSDWIPYNTNLPNVKVKELEIYYDATDENCKLRAATYGRGLWESSLNFNEIYTPSTDTYTPTNLTQTSATLNGEILNNYGEAITASGFVYSLTPNPEIGADGTTNILNSATSGAFSEEIYDLSPSSLYYVRAYAENSEGVGYGPEISFSTSCGAVSSFPYIQGFNSSSTPSCWTEEIITTVGGTTPELSYITYSSSPSASPYEGSHFLSFNSGTCEEGSAIRLFTPAFNTTGKTKITVDFAWYHSSNYKFYKDSLIVQYSTDGTNWTGVDTILRPANVSEWKDISIDLPASTANQTNLYIGLLFRSEYGSNCLLDNFSISAEEITCGITAQAGCGAGDGTIRVSSNINANQTFYLRDNNGNPISSVTETAEFHDFTSISDGTYRGQVQYDGNMSELSDNVVLTNSSSTPVKPTDVLVDINDICGGTEVNLSYTGGSGNTFVWYNDTELTSIIGEGNNFKISPTDTTTYYGRWENGCGVSDEDSVKINAITATSISIQPSDINANALDSIAFIVKANGDNLTYQWRYNGDDINAKENDTLIINPVQGHSKGFYTVKITGTCGDIISTQALLSVTGTGINENDDVEITIYPNPTEGIVTLEMPHFVANTTIKLISISGKVVMTQKIKKRISQLDLSDFSTGSYILEIKNSEYLVKKIIILK